MPSKKEFDPNKFIDREFEQELFEELLHLQDPARILAIQDAGGMGKSELLRKFQYRCRTAERPRIPVALIELQHLPDQSPLSLVLQLHHELSAFLDFPAFTALDTARRAYDFTTIRGAVSFERANLTQAQITTAGVMNRIDQVDTLLVQSTGATFTTEQQVFAHERCVQAFFTDLAHHCQQQLVVLLLDGYEHCASELQTWLVDYFLEPYCFHPEKRPPHLRLVLAGRELPAFHNYWPATDCALLVKSRDALGKWTPAHVEACLRVHGFRYTKRDLKTFCDMIEMGISPSVVVQAIESILRMGERRP